MNVSKARFDFQRPARMGAALLVVLLLGLACWAPASAGPATPAPTMPRTVPELDSVELVAANQWVETLHLVDWLGPLAPVALSPFFGISLLSGLSIWGPDWMPANALLDSSAALQDRRLFAVFVFLTVLTSLPRLTKVSKPFAQAMDRLETYGTIITLLVIRFLAEPATATVDSEVVQAGVISFTSGMLLSIAMVINVLIINSVKFFFEFLVWVTPIPTLDALFEIANKSFCAALMGLYAFSPTLATVLNLLLLLTCAVVLRWIQRRVVFYRSMVLDPILSLLWMKFRHPARPQLVVFPAKAWQRFPGYSRVQITREATCWRFRQSRWLFAAIDHPLQKDQCVLRIQPGWFTNELAVLQNNEVIARFHFSHRHRGHLDQLAELLGAELLTTTPAQVGWTRKEFQPVA